MNGKSLKKIIRLFRRKKYTEVIRHLEPQVYRYRESFKYYYLLGISCLYTGDYGGSYSYLKRGAQLNPDDTDTILGLAAIHLKRLEIEDSLRLWLSIIDIHPNNRKAKQGLVLLKKKGEDDYLNSFVESNKLYKLFPSPGIHIPFWIFAVILIVGAGAILFFNRDLLQNISFSRSQISRPGVEYVVTRDNENIIEYSGNFEYILTENEIYKSIEKIKKLFNNFDDNLAIVEINRILLSNASQSIKERLLMLLDYVAEPNFTNFKNNFLYIDVLKEPGIYNGCYVIWRGKITNLNITEEYITFDFLVGYEKEKVLEGIVPVYLEFAANMEPSFSFEILAQIQTTGDEITLRGISVHQLGP
jgi:tetratricopeptide (TPR) repeat protein